MAISRERLEELIKEGATIYWVCSNQIEKTSLKNKHHGFFIANNKLVEYNKKQGICLWEHKLSKLFETKEEAKWFLEFGNITRTEKLELPSWEEFWNSGKTIWFIGKDGGQYAISQYSREILLNDEYIGYLNKESYIKACRKAKELFMGR